MLVFALLYVRICHTLKHGSLTARTIHVGGDHAGGLVLQRWMRRLALESTNQRSDFIAGCDATSVLLAKKIKENPECLSVAGFLDDHNFGRLDNPTVSILGGPGEKPTTFDNA
jgi:hypothetical protein